MVNPDLKCERSVLQSGLSEPSSPKPFPESRDRVPGLEAAVIPCNAVVSCSRTAFDTAAVREIFELENSGTGSNCRLNTTHLWYSPPCSTRISCLHHRGDDLAMADRTVCYRRC